MRIGIVCYPTFGGSGVVATELAMALAAAGDEVHVVSYALPIRLELGEPRLNFHQVVVPHYPLFDYPPYSLALATTLVEVARHANLDLVHVHYAVPNAVSAVLAREILEPQPLKVLTTLHGTDITLVGNDPNYLETTRFGIIRSDAVTAVSEALKRETQERIQVDSAIEVIPNFIDPSRYENIGNFAGARSWADPEEKILIHVSNFRPVKRVLDVVKVFDKVREKVKARLLLVGDGPDRAKVEQHCRQGGNCDQVTFIGNVAAIERILVGADLFLLPSETESFGLSALEALSCEVPVIATEVGGLPEVVTHGKTGYLFPVGDVDSMAEAAIELLQNDQQRREFGRAGRADAVERFSEREIVGRYRALYEKTLSESSSAAG